MRTATKRGRPTSSLHASMQRQARLSAGASCTSCRSSSWQKRATARGIAGKRLAPHGELHLGGRALRIAVAVAEDAEHTPSPLKRSNSAWAT